MLLDILLWLALSYVIASAFEYVLHRWPMHNKALVRLVPLFKRTFTSHAVLHHGRFYSGSKGFENNPDPVAIHVGVDLGPESNLMFSAPVWASLLIFWSIPAALTFMACAALHGIIWTMIHREMHKPERAWFTWLWPFSKAYAFWRGYHKAHHDHPNRNFNVVCPLFDFIFGTYVSPTARGSYLVYGREPGSDNVELLFKFDDETTSEAEIKELVRLITNNGTTDVTSVHVEE